MFDIKQLDSSHRVGGNNLFIPKNIMQRSHILILLLIFIVALALRLSVAFYLAPEIKFDDAAYYDRMANNVCAGKGAIVSDTMVANRMPLYPYTLAFFKLYAPSQEAYIMYVRFFQSVLNACLVIPIFFIVSVVAAPVYGFLAAALIAFDPIHIFSSSLLLTEVLYSFCLTVFMWSVIFFKKRRTLPCFFLSVVSLIAGMYVRESMFHVTAILFLCGMFFKRCKDIRAYLLILFMISVCALSPWIIRNHALLHKFVPFTTNAGFTLYDSVNPQADGGTDISRFRNDLPDGLSEFERDQFWKRKAIEAVRTDPDRIMYLALKKFVKFWNVIPNAPEFKQPVFIVGFCVFYIPLFLCFIIGMVVMIRIRTCEVFLMYVPLIYALLLHLIINGSLRYRMPFEPFVIVFAVFGAKAMWEHITMSRGMRS